MSFGDGSFDVGVCQAAFKNISRPGDRRDVAGPARRGESGDPGHAQRGLRRDGPRGSELDGTRPGQRLYDEAGAQAAATARLLAAAVRASGRRERLRWVRHRDEWDRHRGPTAEAVTSNPARVGPMRRKQTVRLLSSRGDQQSDHLPKKRWVKVAIKLISMRRPMMASAAAKTVIGSSSGMPPGKKPRP